MGGSLNLFQAAMLRWRALYPYNAVHVVRVPMPLDVARLEALASRQLESSGLTGLTLDSTHKNYEWGGGEGHVRVQVLSGGADPDAVIQAEMERQLNVSFIADGRIDPFRFFAVDGGASFDLGLAYDHFVAGGDSIALFLGRLVDAYSGVVSGAEAQRPTVLYPPTYRHLFGRQMGALIRGLPGLYELIANCRRSARPHYSDAADGYNAVAFLRLAPAQRERLARAAGKWTMTPQNELLLAILLRSLAACAPKRALARRRRELAVATIVNVRADFGPAAADGFVPLLASFRIAHPVPPDVDLPTLASFVHRETTRIKSGKLYLLTLLGIGLSGLQWSFLSTEKRQTFHAKHYPVWAGITPLRVDALWPGSADRVPRLEYVRAVSTGPLSPLVVAITTLGEVMHIAFSFRTTAFARGQIDQIKADMLRCIEDL